MSKNSKHDPTALSCCHRDSSFVRTMAKRWNTDPDVLLIVLLRLGSEALEERMASGLDAPQTMSVSERDAYASGFVAATSRPINGTTTTEKE